MSLKWFGDKKKQNTYQAVVNAINITMTQCVIYAKRNHPWKNKTGTLERSHRIVKPAKQSGSKVSGEWGTVGVEYAIYLEISKNWKWLRPTADVIYPSLSENIKKQMKYV